MLVAFAQHAIALQIHQKNSRGIHVFGYYKQSSAIISESVIDKSMIIHLQLYLISLL